ncbi:MAG: FKBP-type peptidyl-prolyl cis-trans isomerase, partial [Pseudomonadales bacterium]
FTVGDGNLLPGFERAMFGLRPGESQVLPISAGNGFGAHNTRNVQRMPRENFSKDLELEAGLIVSFADQQKSELPGVVTGVSETMVEVDFNHPLAGKDLEFEVEILEVEQVSNEIARARN